ncbi:hypothetical protein CJU90_2835 [Yarrowia sp. C11]|nr:hypothetical protein CJU90_2835 [Yarrowia sp. C11]
MTTENEHQNGTEAEELSGADFYSTYKDLTEAEKQADDLERKLKELDEKMDAILESQDMKDLQKFIDEHRSTLGDMEKVVKSVEGEEVEEEKKEES